ncbi:DUF4158 domain-containing protein, partial [Saccharopolyspora halophila]|uniref:DUF4158 domain-containing protein n=1 Tax=Saccharopolyspora halophila TaxID=405551 RepID=UPI0031D77961
MTTRLGFELQLVTVRNAGAFLDDPLGAPADFVDYLAERLGIADTSDVKTYGERSMTRLERQWEIRSAESWREFSDVGGDLGEWIEARAPGRPGTGRRRCSTAVAWLRERKVLLPGCRRWCGLWRLGVRRRISGFGRRCTIAARPSEPVSGRPCPLRVSGSSPGGNFCDRGCRHHRLVLLL